MREAIGPGVRLMVDLNGSYSADLALRMIWEWERFDLSWLEEPVHPDDLAGYRKIKKGQTGMTIAAGEQHHTVHDFEQIVEERLFDILQPDVVSVGGISEWLKVLRLAEAHNLPTSPHFVPIVSTQLVGGSSNALWVEFAPRDNPLGEIMFEVFDEPKSILHPSKGMMRLTETPGLGVTLSRRYDF